MDKTPEIHSGTTKNTTQHNNEGSTTMTQSLESFFAGGGGGKSVSWKDQPIGASVSGTIKAVHPPQQVTDPATKELKTKKDGTPVMQVRIDLSTNFRNFELCKRPDDPAETDNGDRSLYVGGWMTGAVGEALSKAGRNGPPEVGGQLVVQLSERTPNDNPALAPINKFVAAYASPQGVATQEFFAPVQPVLPQSLTPPQPVPPAITNGGYPAASPIQAPIPSAPVIQPQPVVAGPTKPDSISPEAWAQMDDSTKTAVANAMGVPY